MKVYLASILIVVSFLMVSSLLQEKNPYASAERPLVMGVFPRFHPAIARESFKPMAKYLQKELGRRVILDISPNFKAFWKKVKENKFDIVHFNQYHYIRSKKEHGYEVILMNEERGESTLTAAIYIRKDSGIKSVQDLKGKKILFGGGRGAMISYIYATYLLNQAGLKKEDYVTEFVPNPPAAVVSTFYNLRDAVAAGAGDVILNLPIIRKQINASEMEFLKVGERFAHLPWAVNGKLTKKEKEQIQSLLLKLNDSKNGKKILKKAKLTGIRPAKDDDFNPHRKITLLTLGEQY